MLTNATQARSHELMLKQDQKMLQSTEGIAAVQEAYQYLIQVIICQKHSFLHQLTQNRTTVYLVYEFSYIKLHFVFLTIQCTELVIQ